MKKTIFVCLYLYSTLILGQRSMIYAGSFTKNNLAKNWIVEIENKPNSSVYSKNHRLVIDSQGGATVWFKQKLKGNIKISYKRKVLINKGLNDRLSDLNQFWLANDPKNTNIFIRKGKFEEYDSLSLYYVGLGGNTNTTTRFRRYNGNGQRYILEEKNDPQHLLKANKTYQIAIIVRDNTTSFWIDGRPLFSHVDDNLLKEGYFGFRTTASRQQIWNFSVEKL
jgi:Domain of unknown function (DUF6250)